MEPKASVLPTTPQRLTQRLVPVAVLRVNTAEQKKLCLYVDLSDPLYILQN